MYFGRSMRAQLAKTKIFRALARATLTAGEERFQEDLAIHRERLIPRVVLIELMQVLLADVLRRDDGGEHGRVEPGVGRVPRRFRALSAPLLVPHVARWLRLHACSLL